VYALPTHLLLLPCPCRGPQVYAVLNNVPGCDVVNQETTEAALLMNGLYMLGMLFFAALIGGCARPGAARACGVEVVVMVVVVVVEVLRAACCALMPMHITHAHHSC
jgi:hypothetical protein